MTHVWHLIHLCSRIHVCNWTSVYSKQSIKHITSHFFKDRTIYIRFSHISLLNYLVI